MCEINNDVESTRNRFRYEPPNGGWGYVIVISIMIFHFATVIPQTTFGLIFGKFLASIGDETSQTALANGLYFTSQMFSGFITNYLLRKYSYRKVGLAGAIIYSFGTVTTIFVQNLFQLIVCFSILQGVGAGFMLGALYCSFNSYFTTKLDLMNGITQIMKVVGVTVIPLLVAFITENLDFRSTLLVIAAIATINLPSMAVLEPVSKHIKKIPIEDEEEVLPAAEPYLENWIIVSGENQDNVGSCNENGRAHTPLLNSEKVDNKLNSIEAKIHASLENLGHRIQYIKSLKKDENKNIPFIDTELLRKPRYWNMCVGISLTFISDVSFCSLIPVLLKTVGFDTPTIALMMTVSFGSDLVARLLLAVTNIFYRPSNRALFFTGSILMGIFRAVFILDNSYTWRIVTIGILGFVRCFVSNTLVLVIAEDNKEKFPSAFSLSMVITGVTALIFAGLGSCIKSLTGKDEMVVHLSTAGNFLSILCWSVELIYDRLKPNSTPEEVN